jgi:penicillin-binding protein 2
MREESKNFDSLPIRSRLTEEEVAKFTAHQFKFPGVEIKARLFRNYPYGHLASHVVGYIGRINQKEKEEIEGREDEANYRGTQYIGKLGVEQRYERELHGITGVQEVEKSAGRPCRQKACQPTRHTGSKRRVVHRHEIAKDD